MGFKCSFPIPWLKQHLYDLKRNSNKLFLTKSRASKKQSKSSLKKFQNAASFLVWHMCLFALIIRAIRIMFKTMPYFLFFLQIHYFIAYICIHMHQFFVWLEKYIIFSKTQTIFIMNTVFMFETIWCNIFVIYI